MAIHFKRLVIAGAILSIGAMSQASAADRHLDVELNFLSGIPDLGGICLEEHSTDPWAIEACSGTSILASTWSAHAKHVAIEQGSAWELGWGFGLRAFTDSGCFDTCGDGSIYALGPEALLSAEWNPGVRERGWGFTLEFDAGAGAYLPVVEGAYADRFPVYPWGRISVGVAF